MPKINSSANYAAIDSDGMLRIVDWATARLVQDSQTNLIINHGPRPFKMAHSPATGDGLVSNGDLGVDVIRVSAGSGFVPHTHPGDHLLIIIAGEGTITYDGKIYPTLAGQVYMVEGAVPHAVGAITDHVILAVGSPHKPVDSPERMTVVEYQEVVAEIGSMTCLICNLSAEFPQMIHELSCPHCPCIECNPISG